MKTRLPFVHAAASGLAFAAAFNLCQLPATAAETISLPDWKVTDFAGKTTTAADTKGKVVLLDFWATWCPPCRAEIPGLIGLQKKFADKGVVIIGVAVDQSGEKTVKDFVARHGINYSVATTSPALESAFGGIANLPTLVVIGPEGNVVSRHIGYTEPEELAAEILKLTSK